MRLSLPFPKGISIIELMIGTMLGVGLIALALKPLGLTMVSLNRANLCLGTSLANANLKHELEKIVENTDSHRFYLPPRIHVNGLIRFTDRTPNPVLHSAARQLPDPKSDAITTLRLSTGSTLKVKECEKQGNELLIQACFMHLQAVNLNKQRGFIAVGPDGLEELAGEISGSSRCRQGRLRPSRSMSVPALEHPLECTLSLLVPIDDHYTLYQDRTGRVRHLGHSADRNIENQPLLSGPKSIRFSATSILAGAGYEVQIAIGYDSKQALQLAMLTQLGRLDHLSLLLAP